VTYGELRFRLTKAFPGVDADLIDGWIQDTYADVLAELSWSRQQKQAILQTVAPYETGTVEVTEGSASITGTGTVWTAAMTGRQFHVVGRNESYTFTRASDTTATLDRAYEGDTAATASYEIFKSTYALPSNCRLLEDGAFSPLTRLGSQQFTNVAFGAPQNWASSMDDTSTPPLMQIELYPIPEESIGIPFTYTADVDTLSSTSAAMKAWIQPAALIEGTTAKIKAHLKDYVGSAFHIATYEKALGKMRGVEADGMAATEIQLPSHYTEHRRRRW
jgi:hypothetical protein